MNKTELLEKIKKICEMRNDIRIDMTVEGENRSFDAKYVFLSKTGVYVTDTLRMISIDELDTGALNRIYKKIASE
jgi:hypothetical protein